MRFVPRTEKFFHFFIDQAGLIHEAAQIFRKGVENGSASLPDAEVSIARLEQKGDEIIHEVFTRLNQTFITPLDPEDIHSLASHMDDVLDAMEEAVHRIVAYKITVIPQPVIDVSRILENCAVALQKAFAAMAEEKPLLEYAIEINRLEDQADHVIRAAVADLFESERDPIKLIKLKEIYEYLELATDYCEDVADALQNVIVKNG